MFNKCLELYVNRKDVATCEKNIKEELNIIHLLLLRWEASGVIAKYKSMMGSFHQGEHSVAAT